MDKNDKTQEALSSKINPTGAGEDQAIRELVSGELGEMSNVDAAKLALALSKIIRGEFSEQFKQNEKNMSRILERMEAMDRAQEKYEQDQKKFIEEVFERADKLKVSGEQLEEMKAQTAKSVQQAMVTAQAKMAENKLRLEEELKTMPRETVVAGGEAEIITIGGKPEIRIRPEIIRIRHKTWVLQPGVPTEVPRIVAQELRRRQESKNKTNEFKKILQSDTSTAEVDRALREKRRKSEAPYDPNLVPTV